MTEDTEFQTAVQAPTNEASPVNEDLEALSDEAAMEETSATEQDSEPAAEAPIDIQAVADKNAIFASGKTILDFIYKDKVNNTHAKTANLVAEILLKAERAANWTQEEVTVVWDRVEAEIAAVL